MQKDPSLHAAIVKAVRFSNPEERALRDDSAHGTSIASEDIESTLKEQLAGTSLPRDYPLKYVPPPLRFAPHRSPSHCMCFAY